MMGLTPIPLSISLFLKLTCGLLFASIPSTILSLSLSMSRKSNIERASAACNFALFNHMTWVLLFESFPSKRLLPLSIKSLSLSFLFLIYVGVIKNKKSDNACYVLLFYLIIPFFVKSLLCNF